MQIEKIEVARSYSRKVGLPQYSSVDFFCSAKAEVPWSDREEASDKLYQFCAEQVSDDVIRFTAARQEMTEPPTEPSRPRHYTTRPEESSDPSKPSPKEATLKNAA